MARILSIDFGLKRCGIAVTDPLQIIVNGLTTVSTKDIYVFLNDYLKENEVVKIVLGYPYQMRHTESNMISELVLFKENLQKAQPFIEILFYNEANSSSDASKIIYQSGVRKKQRRDKSLIDKMSAVVILQRYLGHI